MMKNRIFILFLSLGLVTCKSDEAEPKSVIEFTTEPKTMADHNREYGYKFGAESKSESTISFSVDHPDWLKYDEENSILRGRPEWKNLGRHNVRITATDGTNEEIQSFTIEVGRGEIICNQDFGDPNESPYVLPYKVGENYKITQSYCRTQQGGHHLTFAYDFNLAIGDTIRASRSGLVYRVQESYEDGNGESGRENFIYLEHDDGTVFRYVHLTENGALVGPNTRVEQGQAIGLSGLTGATSRPHLHLELFRNRDFNSTEDRSRKFSLPVNFKNAEGPLDENKGLILNQTYTALEY